MLMYSVGFASRHSMYMYCTHFFVSSQDGEEASILHKDPGARALMDMLGKTQAGRDFLDTSNAA